MICTPMPTLTPPLLTGILDVRFRPLLQLHRQFNINRALLGGGEEQSPAPNTFNVSLRRGGGLFTSMPHYL